jgi:hypothetical protein
MVCTFYWIDIHIAINMQLQYNYLILWSGILFINSPYFYGTIVA